MARSGLIDSQSDLIGSYGQNWKQGVLSEHLRLWDGEIKHLRGGSQFAVDARGRAWPVVCSELVRIETEDGPISGRCGGRIVDDSPWCGRHWFDPNEIA